VINALLTVGTALFIVELTDKDALLILSLATRLKALLVFAAGSVAFFITSAIIVTLGQLLIRYVPVFLITLAGGTIMIGYGVWSFLHANNDEQQVTDVERKLSVTASKGLASVFLAAVGILIFLDLAGDSTEILIILFVARFDPSLVFTAAVVALVSATAVETAIGNRLSRMLSARRIRVLSLVIFLAIGTTAILSVMFHT
jgi:putative Ca2+/H+ antiporter (TMEM165/GDT1 family)